MCLNQCGQPYIPSKKNTYLVAKREAFRSTLSLSFSLCRRLLSQPYHGSTIQLTLESQPFPESGIFRGLGTPKSSPFYFRIFHEINHPAGLGIPMNMETSIFQKGIQSFPYLNPSNPSFWVKWTIMLLGGFGYGVGQMDLCKHPQKRWQHEKLMILRLFSTNHIQFIYMWIDMIIANNNYLNE